MKQKIHLDNISEKKTKHNYNNQIKKIITLYII